MKDFLKMLAEGGQKVAAGVMLLAGLLLLAAVLVTGSQDALAQTSRNLPVPQRWVDRSGTNSFGLDASAIPVVMLSGTNYTAVSTNVPFLLGTGVTNRLRIVNGIITGVLAY